MFGIRDSDLFILICVCVQCKKNGTSRPQGGTLTSSHSEVNEGDFSSLLLVALQLDTDSLRPPNPVSSSPGGDTSRSESDFERLRASLRSPGGGILLVSGGSRAGELCFDESRGSLWTVA